MADLRAVPTLAELVDAPERAADLSPADALVMLAKVGSVEAVLRARAFTPTANGSAPEPPDQFLTPDEVAERMKLTRRQVYSRARRWPFTRRPSEGTLRFSERGLERFMAGNTGGRKR